jgi:hypothetical protein
MPFTQQELEDAYKQMQAERDAEAGYAAKAAKKLKALVGQHVYIAKRNKRGTSPFSDVYDLTFNLSQYDAIPQAARQQLGIKRSMIVGRGKVENGEFDLGADPDFANSLQKLYRVIVQEVDAHVGGW